MLLWCNQRRGQKRQPRLPLNLWTTELEKGRNVDGPLVPGHCDASVHHQGTHLHLDLCAKGAVQSMVGLMRNEGVGSAPKILNGEVRHDNPQGRWETG